METGVWKDGRLVEVIERISGRHLGQRINNSEVLNVSIKHRLVGLSRLNNIGEVLIDHRGLPSFGISIVSNPITVWITRAVDGLKKLNSVISRKCLSEINLRRDLGIHWKRGLRLEL